MGRISTYRELEVYRRAFALQQDVFQATREFPRDERYSLTSQIRDASRSIGANIAEAWRKRRYPAHFVSKLTDADAEFAETEHWIHTAEACGYVTQGQADASGPMSHELVECWVVWWIIPSSGARRARTVRPMLSAGCP